jgi:predicted nucleic acid-binding protein
MIVVSDTSPLNYLVLIGAIDVLPQLFGDVHVPPAVIGELQHPATPAAVKSWVTKLPDWVVVAAPSGRVALDPSLDLGEAEAIALALELGAVAILVDEKRGRRVATAQGLTALSTITVLELAAERGLLRLVDAFESLKNTSFHITTAILDASLARDAARKQSSSGDAE